MSNNKHFADLLKVCSILPALAIMPAMAEDFMQNGASKNVKNGEIFDLSQYDSVLFDGGAKIQNYGTVKLGGDVRFENATMHNNNSSVEEQKKIVYEGDGNITFVNSRISNPGVEYSSNPPAIVGGLVDFRTTGDISFSGDMEPTGSSAYVNTTVLSDMVLQANKISVSGAKSDGYGGAIFNAGDLKILGKENLFTDNHQTAVAAESKYYKLGGGALYNRGAEGTAELVVGLADGSSVNKFISNSALQNGGAIETRTDDPNSHSVLDVIGKTTFSENTAGVNGGAIMNWVDSSQENATSVINIIGEVNFDNNTAGKNGGAIYNNGTLDLTGAESTFVGNKANESGGAIYNEGKLNIADAEFEGNKIIGGLGDGGAIYSDGSLTITNSDFSDNYAKENVDGDVGYGGAIFARGEKVEIQGGEFENNHALTAGAVYISKHALTTTIDGVEFDGNWASDIGALAVMGKDVTLNNLKFANNYTTGDFAGFNDGAGALFFGSESQSKLTGGNFVNNESASRGGAIATRVAQNAEGTKNNNSGAFLDIVDSTFVKNTATTDGGAIYNTFYNSVEVEGGAYVAKSSFVGNKATNGGAIYNDGTEDYNGKHAVLNLSDLTFADNIASDKGGAIFNSADAVINMSGTNAFTNNTANKGANDIYNAGTLNITGGETTIGGGILGNGTLTLAEGAVLNIGNATIRQNNLDIDGIVKVSVLSDRSYGRLIAAENLDVDKDTAELHLSLGSVGEYNMFGGKDAGFSTIKYGDTYNVTELGGGIIKVETKSVEQLAQDTGLTTQAAGVVAGLANSHDSTLQKVSLAAQQALNAGDKALVEQETKKLNPEEKPVVQALASAVQNQVLSLASGRMAGGVAMGRAGGDSSQENGFWMHGLFNKSKLDGQFHGYTRGVAFGMDTIIDGKYILGGGLAFNNSDVHSSGRGDTDIDSKTLFLYGQYKPNNWFANMTLTYNMAEYDETKSVFGYNINNVYDVDSYGAQIMGGYDFNTGITTEAGLRYLHIDQDAYADISATKTDFLTSVAGIKYAFAIENDWAIELRPELRAALTYDIISEADAATIDMPGVASYKVAGENLDRLGGEFGIGLTADYKGLKVTLMYDLDLHKDYTSQTGMIKFRTQF